MCECSNQMKQLVQLLTTLVGVLLAMVLMCKGGQWF